MTPDAIFHEKEYKEQERNASTNRVTDIVGESDYRGQWRHVDRKNDDAVVACLTRTKFQRIIKLHNIAQNTYHLSEGITLRTIIPFEDESFTDLKVEGLYETPTYYVVITRMGLRKTWQLVPKNALEKKELPPVAM